MYPMFCNTKSINNKKTFTYSVALIVIMKNLNANEHTRINMILYYPNIIDCNTQENSIFKNSIVKEEKKTETTTRKQK